MEQYHKNTENLSYEDSYIDEMSTLDALKFILEDQLSAVILIDKVLPVISNIVNEMYAHINNHRSGRLVYSGAGTSGRIGVQDGTEIFPTFGWPKSKVKFIIAGGKKAVFEAVENAEDNLLLAKKEVEKLQITNKDIVIGLSASGNTPFTCEVLRLAFQKKALTIGISNNINSLLHKVSKHTITVETGAEAVSGSTRLKAGTSQKIILNLISTVLFSKLGFVKNGMMINMMPTNSKLRKRKKLINKILFNKK
jgi:N-acetylmuramic acid 6-phosphate etherase